MQANANPPPLEQISDAARRTAEAVESLRAELVAVRGRVDALEGQLLESQAAQRRTAERIERVAAEAERLKGLEALIPQIEALREAHVRADERIEAVATQLLRIARLENTVAQLGTALGQEIEAQAQVLRGEVAAQAKQRVDDGRAVAREIQALGARLEAAERFGPRLDALARRQDEETQAIHAAVGRIEQVAADGPRFEESLSRGEQRFTAQLAGLAARVETLDAAIGAWRERIEAQSEAVRAAQGVADLMQAEVARILAAHHATSEAQRVAEGRVDATLAATRDEIEARWERFLAERAKHWAAWSRAIDTREAETRAAIDAARAEVLDQVDALQAGLEAGLGIQARDVTELHRQVAAFVRGLHDFSRQASETLEPGLPSADPSAVSAERRQALRRALRARREP
jgi:DNA repair exonuclease SbcCD ATPase subunit